jgi:hypothetical protein
MYSATRELMLCFGFCFAREIGLIQLAHISKVRHEPLDMGGFIVMTSLILNTWLNTQGAGVNEYYLLLLLTVFAIGAYSHFAVFITQDFCKELQIEVFKVKSKSNLEHRAVI